MIRQIECVVSGKVQGVLYRDFTRRKARRLELTGIVENVPNGTVYVLAQGEEELLKKFITDLEQGSIFSKVDAVRVSWSEVRQVFKDFRIQYRNISDWF
ncbi:MAG: acylphosphatase [Patescibacteria group bacterium]